MLIYAPSSCSVCGASCHALPRCICSYKYQSKRQYEDIAAADCCDLHASTVTLQAVDAMSFKHFDQKCCCDQQVMQTWRSRSKAHIWAQDCGNGWLERHSGPKSIVHNPQGIVLSLEKLLRNCTDLQCQKKSVSDERHATTACHGACCFTVIPHA